MIDCRLIRWVTKYCKDTEEFRNLSRVVQRAHHGIIGRELKESHDHPTCMNIRHCFLRQIATSGKDPERQKQLSRSRVEQLLLKLYETRRRGASCFFLLMDLRWRYRELETNRIVSIHFSKSKQLIWATTDKR